MRCRYSRAWSGARVWRIGEPGMSAMEMAVYAGGALVYALLLTAVLRGLAGLLGRRPRGAASALVLATAPAVA